MFRLFGKIFNLSALQLLVFVVVGEQRSVVVVGVVVKIASK